MPFDAKCPVVYSLLIQPMLMLFQRSLRESNDAISDLKGKLRVLNHQFDQLKEEIDAKETALIKVTQEQTKIIKEKEDLQSQVECSKKDVKETNENLGTAEKSNKLMQDKHRSAAFFAITLSLIIVKLKETKFSLNSQLSKGTSGLKQKSTKLLTSFSDKVFHSLSIAVVRFF